MTDLQGQAACPVINADTRARKANLNSINTAPRRSWAVVDASRDQRKRESGARPVRSYGIASAMLACGCREQPRRGRLEVVSFTRRDGAETGDTVGVGVGIHYYREADGDQRRGGSSGG